MRINIHRLKLAMARQQLSARKLSQSSGISHATISAIMCGKSCHPATLGKLARALGLDPADLTEQ